MASLGIEGTKIETPIALLNRLGRILVLSSVRAVKVMQAVSRTVVKRSSIRFTFDGGINPSSKSMSREGGG